MVEMRFFIKRGELLELWVCAQQSFPVCSVRQYWYGFVRPPHFPPLLTPKMYI